MLNGIVCGQEGSVPILYVKKVIICLTGYILFHKLPNDSPRTMIQARQISSSTAKGLVALALAVEWHHHDCPRRR
jgi:hypothetical protein